MDDFLFLFFVKLFSSLHLSKFFIDFFQSQLRCSTKWKPKKLGFKNFMIKNVFMLETKFFDICQVIGFDSIPIIVTSDNGFFKFIYNETL